MDSPPFVSVVTPFFNTAPYLGECIESVIDQSYKNWEYVLVNNCSTDGSAEIARKYAQADSRIRVVDNERHLSQVRNYNHALRQISSSSRYCKVVQADDWIFPECITEMVKVAEAHPTIGIVAAYWLAGTLPFGGGLHYRTTFMPGADLCRWQLLNHPDKYVFGTATSILVRSDLVRERDPFYDEHNIYEDIDVCYRLLRKSDFGFVHQVLSYTRVENESVSSRIRNLSPYVLIALLALQKYGPIFLNQNEYEARLHLLTDRYYRILANAFVYGHCEGFWDYHKLSALSSGYKIDRTKLLAYALWEAASLVRHPRALIRRFMNAYV